MWTSKSSVTVACFLPGRAKDLSAPLYHLRYYASRTLNTVTPCSLPQRDPPLPSYGPFHLPSTEIKETAVLSLGHRRAHQFMAQPPSFIPFPLCGSNPFCCQVYLVAHTRGNSARQEGYSNAGGRSKYSTVLTVMKILTHINLCNIQRWNLWSLRFYVTWRRVILQSCNWRFGEKGWFDFFTTEKLLGVLKYSKTGLLIIQFVRDVTFSCLTFPDASIDQSDMIFKVKQIE